MAKRPEHSEVGAPFAELYDQLHAMAARELRGQRTGHTLQPTALVHEAWLRVHGLEPTGNDADTLARRRFFCTASKAMRHVLIDHARRRRAAKRGGGDPVQASITDAPAPSAATAALDALALDEALAQLEQVDAELVPLAELRLYAGLSLAQAADTLGWPLSTAKNRWTYAVAVLSKALRASD